MTWRTDRYRNAARRARLRRARKNLDWLTLRGGTVEAMCRAHAVRLAFLGAMLVFGCDPAEPSPNVADASARVDEFETVVADDACDQDFCDQDGWCADIGGTCVATLPEHCTRSVVCIKNGCCALDSGDCVCTQENP